MIKSFRCKDTEKLFRDRKVRTFDTIERIARRKLYLLHGSKTLEDLKVPPGNKLEKLSGNREGQWSIRINNQWRICFMWEDGDCYQVEIVDYH